MTPFAALDTVWEDVRYGARWLARSPVFACTAAISLAIGIGANTTIFAVANALLLRPLPGVVEPSQLVDIGRTQEGNGFDTSSYPNYLDVRARARTVSDVYAIQIDAEPMGLGGSDGADRIYGTIITANYFTILGTRPAAGRLLIESDDAGAPGSHPVLVISYDLWQRRFGGRADVVGTNVPLNGYPFVIVGVAPRGFQGTTVMRSDVWVPITSSHLASPRLPTGLLQSRRGSWLLLGARLRPGVTVAQANADLSAIAASLEREFPRENRGRGLKVLRSSVIPGQTAMFASFIGLLMALVGLVLLIACVNLSGMLLARGAGRQREIAVRLAMGASRARLARQLLTETTVLFTAGGVLGVLVSGGLRAVLLGLLPHLPVPIGLDMPIDVRVLAFAVVISGAAAALAGIAPALQASSPNLVQALKADGHGSIGGRVRLRSAFLIAQVAMSLVLVLAAGLFMRALSRASAINPGFDEAGVDVVMLDLSLARYTDATGVAFAREMRERVAALPGVRAAALVTDLPLDGGRMGFGSIRTPGLRRGDSDRFEADWNVVSPQSFAALGVPLMKGRDFTDTDRSGAPLVAVINETMARAIWGTTDAVGRTIELSGPRETWQTATVVGIAADAHVFTLDGPIAPYIYVPLAQRYTSRLSVVVKNSGPTNIPRVRTLLREMNPNLPVAEAMPLSQVTAINVIPQRVAGSVAGALGIVGLLLAAIGIYGVASYNVNRRVREIAIRVALGASVPLVLRLVLRQGMALIGAGVVLGLLAGGLGAQVLRSLLFGISAVDPLTFGGGAVLFMVVALAAMCGPALRAARVDPIVALRAE